jgi:hypothetical protein
VGFCLAQSCCRVVHDKMAPRKGMKGGSIVSLSATKERGYQYHSATPKGIKKGVPAKSTIVKGMQVPWASALQQAWHEAPAALRRKVNADTKDPENITARKKIFADAKERFAVLRESRGHGMSDYNRIAFSQGKHAKRNKRHRDKTLAHLDRNVTPGEGYTMKHLPNDDSRLVVDIKGKGKARRPWNPIHESSYKLLRKTGRLR